MTAMTTVTEKQYVEMTDAECAAFWHYCSTATEKDDEQYERMMAEANALSPAAQESLFALHQGNWEGTWPDMLEAARIMGDSD